MTDCVLCGWSVFSLLCPAGRDTVCSMWTTNRLRETQQAGGQERETPAHTHTATHTHTHWWWTEVSEVSGRKILTIRPTANLALWIWLSPRGDRLAEEGQRQKEEAGGTDVQLMCFIKLFALLSQIISCAAITLIHSAASPWCHSGFLSRGRTHINRSAVEGVDDLLSGFCSEAWTQIWTLVLQNLHRSRGDQLRSVTWKHFLHDGSCIIYRERE